MRTTIFSLALAATVTMASPAFAADTVNYNVATPPITFTYGSGNNYSPANAAVLVTSDPTSTIEGRAHIRGPVPQTAPTSDASGVYSFANGTDVGFDYSFSNMLTGRIQLINLLTGQTWDSGIFPLIGATLQDSQPFGQVAFASLGFSPFDNTYQVNLIGTNANTNEGPHTLTFYAKFGAGAGSVPEPATWAMMLLGFGGIGASMRRQRRPVKLTQLA